MGDRPPRDRNAFHQWVFQYFYRYRTQTKPPPDIILPLRFDDSTPAIYVPGQQQQMTRPFYQGVRGKLNIDEVTEASDLPARYKRAYENVQDLKIYFANINPRLRYRKCLGWGGNGLAAALDDIDENGKKTRSLVAKVLFRDDEASAVRETGIMQIYEKAEHIVQLIYKSGSSLADANRNKRPSSSPDSPPKRVKRSTDHNDEDEDEDEEEEEVEEEEKKPSRNINVFITEMLENGDLSEFICLVRDHKEKVPNTVLWRFLLCLVRMCIAMAYPPASLPGNRNVPGPITETVPPEGLRAKWFKRMVHFDMDPKNIFVGDLMVGPEHRVTPILKLGDFGLAQEVRERMEGGYYERLRYIGKVGYYCPEQFCQDWDYIPENSKKTYKHPIAGNYGPHSNLWAAGYVMETLITLCYPAQPPHPTKTTRNPPRSKTEYLTYAAHLSQSLYSHVDPDLISVIFRLQAHSPADRPDLADLENYVLNRYPAGLRERNSATEWIQKVLYEPPPQRSSFDPAAAYAQIKVYRPALIPVPVLSSSSAEQGKGGVEEEIKRKKLPGLQDRRDLEVAPQNQNQEPPTPRPALARALAPIPLPIPPRLNPPVGELNRPRPTPGFQAPVGELNRPRPPPGSQGGSRNTAGSGRGRGGETRRPTRPPWRF